MTENPRTTAARDHDDKDLIEGMEPAGDAEALPGGSHGRPGRALGSKADLERVSDPDGHTRQTKADDMATGQSYPADRRGPNG